MTKTSVIQVEVEGHFLKEIDRYKKENFYRSRAELVRDLLRDAVTRKKSLLEEHGLTEKDLEDIMVSRKQIKDGKYRKL
ncbi:hypothetical protein K8R43_04150 [archaeon]|nr:hypothetical protein [archaeon]